jgi:hypothetical protein
VHGCIRSTRCILAFISLSLSVYIEAMVHWCFAKHKISRTSRLYLEFKISNDQSKSLNMIFILKLSWICCINLFRKHSLHQQMRHHHNNALLLYSNFRNLTNPNYQKKNNVVKHIHSILKLAEKEIISNIVCRTKRCGATNHRWTTSVFNLWS